MILLVDVHHTAQCKSVCNNVLGQGWGSKLVWRPREYKIQVTVLSCCGYTLVGICD
jgi:hypothetical protein